MYQIIASILLKFGLGFISDKFRTYGAEKLQDGDLADQKFRRWIVRELDDIKFKLDGLSRKDLSTSISFLKQCVDRLHMSLGESTESGDLSTSESMTDGKKSQDTTNAGASTSTQTKSAQKSSTLEDAIALANAIGKLKIQSNERLKIAKESFKKAAEKASEAFHNAALSTDERVLASKVRIASGILEHLEDPEVAASDCLQYLQELHDMPAIQEIFSVQIKAGIKSWIKSAFKKDSRAEIVETVTMINLILADFISRFTKRRMSILEWPMIGCGKRIIHPIHYEEEGARKIKDMGITVPWEISMIKKSARFMWPFAINSKGNMIGVNYWDNLLRKHDRVTGECQLFCVSASDDATWEKRSIAIDDNDTVYVLRCKVNSDNPEATVSVYSSGGKVIRHCCLDFITGRPHLIAVSERKNIFIYCGEVRNGTVYVCESNGKLIKTFPIRLQSHELATNIAVFCNASSDNEMIIKTRILHGDSVVGNSAVRVYTQEGQLKRTLYSRRQQLIHHATFDHVTKNYIIHRTEGSSKNTYVECLSETGERRNILCLDVKDITGIRSAVLVSHANGVIAIASEESVFYLRSSIM